MAIYTTTTLGPNSSVIEVPATWTEVDLLDSIQAVLEGQGWTLSSSSVGGSTGDTDWYHKHHVGDTDVAFYKRLDVNCERYSSDNKIKVRAGEKANPTGSPSTNNSSQYAIELGNSVAGRLYMFNGDGYDIFMWRSLNDTTKGFIGCLELDNFNNQPFGTGASDYSGRVGAFEGSYMMGGRGEPFDMCSYINSTGNKATTAPYCAITSDLGSWGTIAGNTGLYNLATASNSFISHSDPVTGKAFASNMSYLVNTTATDKTYVGKFYGIKILNKNAGLTMDTVNIKVDANGFCDSAGTDVEHFIITGDGYADYEEVCFAVPR